VRKQRSIGRWRGSVRGTRVRLGGTRDEAPLWWAAGHRSLGRRWSLRGLLEPLSALISPACDEGAVAKLDDGDRCEEDLLAGHEPDLGFEAGASAAADGRAEDAGVDEDPHDSKAAAKASSSSSSSESSSISSESIESSTGAASS